MNTDSAMGLNRPIKQIKVKIFIYINATDELVNSYCNDIVIN